MTGCLGNDVYGTRPLNSGTEYSYQLAGVNASGTGTYSTAKAYATKPSVTVPSLSVISSTQINATLSAGVGANIAVVSFTLERESPERGNWSTVYTGSGTTYDDTGLAPSTQYGYRGESHD